MSFRFGIVGAGWYGCHIASSFRALGFDVTVFESEDEPFSKASGHNQFRLHQGFHYARSYRTRVQSRDGFMRFIERYPGLSAKIDTNLYAVPNSDTLIDFLTYRLIMTSTGIEFREVDPKAYDLNECTGALLTDERLLLTKKAKQHFTARLSGSLRLGERIVSIEESSKGVSLNGIHFDYVVDATWGGLSRINVPVYYEPTLLLYYKSTHIKSYALTMVDGQLCSIYPTEEPDLYTLSSVSHTPLGRTRSMSEAEYLLSQTSNQTIAEKSRMMEGQVKKYYPHFQEHFEFAGPQMSIKTKIIGASDDRSCYVSKQGRRFIVMSGKIDTIFYAVESILSMLEADNETLMVRQ